MLYDENLINTIKDILTTRKQTISVAERDSNDSAKTISLIKMRRVS